MNLTKRMTDLIDVEPDASDKKIAEAVMAAIEAAETARDFRGDGRHIVPLEHSIPILASLVRTVDEAYAEMVTDCDDIEDVINHVGEWISLRDGFGLVLGLELGLLQRAPKDGRGYSVVDAADTVVWEFFVFGLAGWLAWQMWNSEHPSVSIEVAAVDETVKQITESWLGHMLGVDTPERLESFISTVTGEETP